MSVLQLFCKPGNRNLLEVVTKLPQLGVGSRVTRKAWAPYGDSYYEITKVKPRSADGKVGKVWGVLTWRGEREPGVRMIRGRAKRLWIWKSSDAEVQRVRGLARELKQLEQWRQLAAVASSSSSTEAGGRS